ncbi:MAG: hypothetical protein ACKPB3_06170, partial [Bacteroidota bacterium]
MLKQLRFAFAHFLFWLVVFAISRALMLVLISTTADFDFFSFETLGVFWHGLRLDLSMAAYLFVFPLLFIPFLGTTFHNRLIEFVNYYYKTIVAIIALLLTANLVIFRFWGTLLNVRALEFAVYPKEMLASVSNLQIAIIIVFIFAMWWSLSRIRR